MVVKVCGMSDIGKCRELNEDSFKICGFENGSSNGVCVLADGMGGHNAGEIASSKAVELVAGELAESFDMTGSKDICKEIAGAVDYANSCIYEMSLKKREHSGMGTTLVVAFVRDMQLLVANIGDSCAYVVSEKNMRKITVDHSVVEELVQRGTITREQARNHPDKNIITRAVGTEEYVDADFFEYNLQLGETLILCSDGLTEMVEDKKIKELVNNSECVDDVVRNLINEANDNGGVDNITVIALRVEEEEKI